MTVIIRVVIARGRDHDRLAVYTGDPAAVRGMLWMPHAHAVEFISRLGPDAVTEEEWLTQPS